jgi:hypothetical protein
MGWREKMGVDAPVHIEKKTEPNPAECFPGTFIVTDDLEPHAVTGIVPEFDGPGYEAFRENIAKVGQLEPIVLFQGKIIDGRARYRACKELGRPVIARKWEGGMDPTCYISAVNRLRTHSPDTTANIPDPEPGGMGSEYNRLWNKAWKLADFVDGDTAPYNERVERLSELMQMRDRMAEIEKQNTKG